LQVDLYVLGFFVVHDKQVHLFIVVPLGGAADVFPQLCVYYNWVTLEWMLHGCRDAELVVYHSWLIA